MGSSLLSGVCLLCFLYTGAELILLDELSMTCFSLLMLALLWQLPGLLILLFTSRLKILLKRSHLDERFSFLLVLLVLVLHDELFAFSLFLWEMSARKFSLFSTLVLVLYEDLWWLNAAVESLDDSISNANNVDDFSVRADLGDAGKSNENEDSAVAAGGAVWG